MAQTPRLVIRRLTPDDAPFMVDLLNDAAFLRHIGDRNVRTVEDARNYIVSGPIVSYARYGFGHYLVESKDTGEPIGICSLVKREWLQDVDLGFAFLPTFRHHGYALESASAVVAHARSELGLGRLVAIVAPANAPSIALLQKLGFVRERSVRPPDSTADIDLFAAHL